MVWCLMAPSHYSKSCWWVISKHSTRTVSKKMLKIYTLDDSFKIITLRLQSQFTGFNKLKATYCCYFSRSRQRARASIHPKNTYFVGKINVWNICDPFARIGCETGSQFKWETLWRKHVLKAWTSNHKQQILWGGCRYLSLSLMPTSVKKYFSNDR